MTGISHYTSTLDLTQVYIQTPTLHQSASLIVDTTSFGLTPSDTAPFSSLLSPLNDLDINIHPLDIQEADIFRVRQPPKKKFEVVKDVLKMLRNAKIMPTEFLAFVLNTSQPDFAYFHAAFYAERNAQKFHTPLVLFWNGEKAQLQ